MKYCAYFEKSCMEKEMFGMVDFLKYMRGYVRIKVWGFSPERFMNLCSNKGIVLWNIAQNAEYYEMCIGLKNFWALRPIVKKTGTRVAVLGRYGLPFFLPKLMQRKIFVAGLIFAVFFWIWSSFFVWDIELDGNYQITDDMFHHFLKNKGVIVGIKKDSLDIEALEKEIRREFTQITWASAKLDGTKLQISIKENDAPIIVEELKETAGTDLVSKYGGTVVEMIVRKGVPQVAIGDVVEPGAILVEGKVPVYNEDATVREYQYVDSEATIILEHATEFSDSLPFDYIKQEYTGREKKQYYIRWDSSELKMPMEKPFLVNDSIRKEYRPLMFEKLSIPAYFGTITYREYQNVEYAYTLKEAETLLNKKIITFLASLEEKGVQIIEKDVKIDTNVSAWIVEGTFVVREPVGESVPTQRPEETVTENADE